MKDSVYNAGFYLWKTKSAIHDLYKNNSFKENNNFPHSLLETILSLLEKFDIKKYKDFKTGMFLTLKIIKNILEPCCYQLSLEFNFKINEIKTNFTEAIKCLNTINNCFNEIQVAILKCYEKFELKDYEDSNE